MIETSAGPHASESRQEVRHMVQDNPVGLLEWE
jgi:hypothetical protein